MIEMRNPFIFVPIKTGYGDGTGKVNDKHISFYKRRSRYVGAITLEPLYIDRGLREIPTQLGIDADDKVEGLRKLVDIIHEEGAKVIAHLNHPGRMANPSIPGNYFVSSTDEPCPNGGAVPEMLDREGMDKVKELFVSAARRAKEAGFDIIEIQMGHGYLLAQFISPGVNKRKDEYGGSFENRIRFPLEVLSSVMDAVDLPVIVRISGEEMVPGGIEIEEMIQLSRIMKDMGIAAVHVSAGTVCLSPPWFFQHMFIPKGKTWEMGARIQRDAGIPVVYVGRVNSFEDIEILKRDYDASYIGIGRALVADPDFIGKYTGEVEEEPRPCLACSEGCLGGVKKGKGLSCLMNPDVPGLTIITKARKKKEVAVVGGGPAGLESAIILRERGHDVVLFEKEQLGGTFILASLHPRKKELRKAIDYFKREVERRGVEVVYKEAELKDIENFDEVIIATGSKPFVPPIKGLENYNWAEILYPENMPSGEKIFLIGGGLMGVETTSALAEAGNKVILVEILPELGGNMLPLEKAQLLKILKEHPDVELYTNTIIKEVKGDRVIGEVNGRYMEWDGIDRFVVLTGVRSYNPFEGEELPMPHYVIGDAKEPRKAIDAIEEGYNVARLI